MNLFRWFMFWRPKPAKSFTKVAYGGLNASNNGVVSAENGVKAAQVMMDREGKRMAFHTAAADIHSEMAKLAEKYEELKTAHADVL